MTHTSTEQPEALRLAEYCDNFGRLTPIAKELRHLHARVQELEAQTAHMADLVELADYATKKLEASQAQRVPLAMYQRDTIKAKAWRETMVGGYYDANAIIDATEAAHGITQEKQG